MRQLSVVIHVKKSVVDNIGPGTQAKCIFSCLQRGTLSQKERDALAIYNLVPRELDFANVDQVSDNELINDAYRDETFLFREHIKKIEQFRADPLEVLIDHIKVCRLRVKMTEI
jgi:hypothetical protein